MSHSLEAKVGVELPVPASQNKGIQHTMTFASSRRRFTAPLMLLATGALLALSGCAVGDLPSPADPVASEQESPTLAEEVFTPVVASVLADPLLVQASDGQNHVAYELFLTNTMGQSVTLNSLTVLGDGDELLRLRGEDLLPWMRAMGAPSPGYVLAAGQSATVILDVAVPQGGATPQMLNHVIEFSPEAAMPPMVTEQMKQTVAQVAIAESAPLVIGSPVHGDGWLNGNGCCEASPHRSAINPVNGELHAPERFAIDFVQLDDESRIFHGPIDDLASYAYYGAEILAVGDGPIVSMKWDLPEETPGSHPVGLKLNEYGGNHVVQDIGNGRYAFYAHLQGANPENLSIGQVMSRGDVLGYLGNSGNTDMPHLHFHVMDSPLPLASNGLSFVFDEFLLSGIVSERDLASCMLEPQSCNVDASGGTAMKRLMPLQRDVISVVGSK